MEFKIDRQDMLDRFLTYVRVHTTSSEENMDTPSTQCQFDLARILVKELEDMGLEDVRLTEHCYVYAVLPGNMPGDGPPVGFLAHMDVSPAVAGMDVKPVIHKNYDGGTITLPGDPSLTLTPETDAPLGECTGLDIITSDGTTLLGGDDKAGIAIIMAMLKALKANPEIPHGPIHVGFTPDEEVGRGVAKFDVSGFGAEVAYTVDGEFLGEIEEETFCADSMTVTCHGVNVHPGSAKNKMINSVKLAAELIDSLPKDALSPETTEKREGYVHPQAISGTEETTVIKFIIRDFTMEKLKQHEELIAERAQAVAARYPGSRVDVAVSHSYKNMKVMLDKRPEAVEFAFEAVRAAGLEPIMNPIRGGTDGARLSFMGLPTPNIFTGGHNFHGKKEWIPVQHMEASARVCVHLARIWGERGERKGLLPTAD
ncbi:MAG: peptidase T [bacterium]|nr:peptidase T [bacterium]